MDRLGQFRRHQNPDRSLVEVSPGPKSNCYGFRYSSAGLRPLPIRHKRSRQTRLTEASSAKYRFPLSSKASATLARAKPGCAPGIPSTMISGSFPDNNTPRTFHGLYPIASESGPPAGVDKPEACPTRICEYFPVLFPSWFRRRVARGRVKREPGKRLYAVLDLRRGRFPCGLTFGAFGGRKRK